MVKRLLFLSVLTVLALIVSASIVQVTELSSDLDPGPLGIILNQKD